MGHSIQVWKWWEEVHSGHVGVQFWIESESKHKMCLKQSNSIFSSLTSLYLDDLCQGLMTSKRHIQDLNIASLALETVEGQVKNLGFFIAGKGESLKSFKLRNNKELCNKAPYLFWASSFHEAKLVDSRWPPKR